MKLTQYLKIAGVPTCQELRQWPLDHLEAIESCSTIEEVMNMERNDPRRLLWIRANNSANTLRQEKKQQQALIRAGRKTSIVINENFPVCGGRRKGKCPTKKALR